MLFKMYLQFSSIMAGELHGNLEECLMTLGKETSAHFRLGVFMCVCLQEILDMLNASVVRDY